MSSSKDDLKIAWICDECRTVLVFHHDCEMHCKETGHQHLTAFDIETGRMLHNKGVYGGNRQPSSTYGGDAAV